MLTIENSILAQLISIVETVPEESCGFLYGKAENDTIKICKIMPVDNVSANNRTVRYEIAGRDFVLAEKLAETHNLELVGVYHTHLIDSALPSETDRMAAFPNFYYMIISLPNLRFSDMRIWKLNTNHQFKEETFKILT